METRAELSHFLEENNIDVCLLQEIWLKEGEHFKLKGFCLESARRPSGFGGVGILIKASYGYQVVDLGHFLPIEVVAVKIVQGFNPITLVSVYVPPDSALIRQVIPKISSLFETLADIEGEVLVGGDWNGHHPTWDPDGTPCRKGFLINSLIENSALVLLNDGTPTCLTTSTKRSSAVDLTMATSGTAGMTSWTTVEQEFGSSHLSIVMEIGSQIPIAEGKRKCINKEKVVQLINEIRPQYIYDPGEMQQIFKQAIENSSFIVKNKKANYLKRWWTPEINEAYNFKREQLRNYNRAKTETNLIKLQKARASLKRLIRKAKRKYNQELTELIDETTPGRQMWNIIKGIDTALTTSTTSNPQMNTEEGMKFMEYYFDGKLKNVSKPTSTTKKELWGYETALKHQEFMRTLRTKKDYSAPGMDGVTYAMLKKLKPEILEKISEMLNQVYDTEIIPEEWKSTLVKPIPKPNRNPTAPDSKRPIALMNVFLKLINAAIKNRLNEIADLEGILPELSFGFRKNSSAISCVNYLVNTVKEAEIKGKQAVGIFLDLSQAFDCVDTEKMLKGLATLNIPSKMISWIHTYTTQRLLILRTSEGEVLAEVTEGLPQGCPLSPTLFNLYTTALHDIKEEDVVLVQFADDFAVIVLGKTAEEITTKANNFLPKLVEGLEELNLKLNPSKTAAVYFSRKNPDQVKIKIGNHKIQTNNTHKYLGYTLDRTLTHRKHIVAVREAGAKKLGIIKMLGKRSSNANPQTLLKVGNALIRSRYEYGAQIYGNAAKTNMNKLQTLQNAYIRSSMRYLKSTPIHVMLAETGQIPVRARTELLALKDIVKSKFHGNQLAQFIHDAAYNEDRDFGFRFVLTTKRSDRKRTNSAS